MAASELHPRTAEFRSLFMRVLAQLKEFVGTAGGDVIVLSSSGTGAMEAAVSNLTSPGDRVLVLTAGRFGERWSALAKSFGCHVDEIERPYGQTFSLEEIRSELRLETRAVFVQATESSTGVRHDIEGIARLLKEERSEALLVVDGMTGLGTTHLEMDEWGIDALVGSSQQALMVSPGLSYVALSPRGWDRMEATYNPRSYFDLRKERKSAARGESAYSPAVALIAAVGASLEAIAGWGEGDLAEGRRRMVENAETSAAMMRAAATAIGLRLFAPAGHEAAAMTAMLAPEGVDAGAIVRELETRFGVIVSAGRGGGLEGSVFQVAHIGYLDAMDTMGVVAALEQVVAGLKLPLPGFELGRGLMAAQRVFAERARAKYTSA